MYKVHVKLILNVDQDCTIPETLPGRIYNIYTGPDLAPRQDEAGPHLTFQTPRQDGAGGPPHLRWGKERAHATP